MDALPQSILSQTANLPVSAGIAATRRTIRPFLTAILFLVMGFTLSQGNTVFAEEFSTTTATIGNPVEVVELTDEVHQTDDEFLCGWVPLGTHDSVPALVPVPAEPVSASDTPITVPNNNSLFAATTKSLKVTVEKIAEPFVQMGPRIQNSLQQIEAYQRWWQQKVDRSTVAVEFAQRPQPDISGGGGGLARRDWGGLRDRPPRRAGHGQGGHGGRQHPPVTLA